MSDIKFVDGLMVKDKHEKAPDFVKCHISIKRKELIAWLSSESDEWINLDVKRSKGGKLYAEVNTWKPENRQEPAPASGEPAGGFDDDDIPFSNYQYRTIA